jgi:type IV secretory pathway TrbD component
VTSGPTTDPRAAAPGTANPPKRRNTELALLGFAVVITLIAQGIVDLTVTGSLTTELATFGVWFTALWAVAHLVVRRWAAYADPLLLPAVALLVGLGLSFIHRLDLAAQQADSAVSREDAPV